MAVFGIHTWLRAPADRDVIARWTVGAGEERTHALAFPPPPDPERFSFLVVGDTGDSEAAGPRLSPQDAVGREMHADSVLSAPRTPDQANFVLHTGDVVYMTGEKRLYDRNFRRPYAPFLTPESTAENLIFRVPFLPVPGNHDYYDLGSWVRWLSHIPILGTGLRTITHELFAFSLPEGGSDMGGAYMEAFIDANVDTRLVPLPYQPGVSTRLPNRYYRFCVGNVDFFALDSNTLDAPAPWKTDARQVRAEASEHVKALEARADALDKQLRRNQRACDLWRAEHREAAAEDPFRPASLLPLAEAVLNALNGLEKALKGLPETGGDVDRDKRNALASVDRAKSRWQESQQDLQELADAVVRGEQPEAAAVVSVLGELDEASDEGSAVLRALEASLSHLPESEERTYLLNARAELERAQEAWTEAIEPLPANLCTQLHALSEEALDVQRELALERRRMRYRPADHDAEQYRWLRAALEESVRERPDSWRIVYLHHPFYSTISNHCERPDVISVRESLLPILGNHVHLVLSGHSHAFEWFRSAALPGTGLFVTGGGGQVSLRRSLLDPRLFSRYRDRYLSLRDAGVQECAVSGRGPAASDGEEDNLYHYLRIEVTPDVLRVRPIGVRRLNGSGRGHGGYRREEPMPVWHTAELTDARPIRRSRLLEAVEIRRNTTPIAHWTTD